MNLRFHFCFLWLMIYWAFVTSNLIECLCIWDCFPTVYQQDNFFKYTANTDSSWFSNVFVAKYSICRTGFFSAWECSSVESVQGQTMQLESGMLLFPNYFIFPLLGKQWFEWPECNTYYRKNNCQIFWHYDTLGKTLLCYSGENLRCRLQWKAY